MAVEIKVPQVGESITEVFVGEWYVNEGDHVEADQDVVGLESDKASFDVPAPASGTISKIAVQAGSEAAIGDVIGYIEEGEAPGGEDQPSAKQSREEHAEDERQQDEEPAGKPRAKERDRPKEEPRDQDEGAPRVMPAAARLLDEHGLQAEDVPASGPGGRLLKEDVLRHLDGEKAAPDRARQPAARAAGGDRTEETVTASPIRRRIAERLVEAQQNAALLTTFNDVDMSEVIALRKRFRDDFQEQHDVKLGFMSFFVKAAVDALLRFPAVNGEFRGKTIVYRNYCDIGIAVGGGKGLVVPVIRNAEQLGFAEIEHTINDFARRAQSNDLSLEELEGGTFTITNGGIYGSLLSTPIVNPPQSGVLGMHRIEERPVVVDGQIVARPMMYLALTYDHRIVDGREAVTFLNRIKECLEDPTRMILEV